MLYAATFTGCKIDDFLRIFCSNLEWCRSGGLEPSLCKRSRCELSLQSHRPERGWKRAAGSTQLGDSRTLQSHRPERGWKLFDALS